MNNLNGLTRAIAFFDGSQSKLAKAIDVSQAAVSRALRRGGTMSPRSAIKIERVTGGRVPRAEICPALVELEAEPEVGDT